MISIIITYFDPKLRKTGMLSDLIRSIGDCSQGINDDIELVIVPNSNSYVEAVNTGLSRARGDWLIVLNDDLTIIDSQWLSKLCVPDEDVITSHKVGAFHLTGEALPSAHCFAMSRGTFDKLGLMDEIYKDGFNYEDTDYFLTAAKKGIRFVDVGEIINNIGNVTTNMYFNDVKQAKINHNHHLFKQKWGK